MAATAFNSLGQIIAAGGLTSLAVGLSSGWSDEQAAAWLAKNWSGIPPQETQFLIGLAIGMVVAGGRATEVLGDMLPSEPEPGVEQIIIETSHGTTAISLDELRQLSQQNPELYQIFAEQVDLENFPIVPELFGDEPLGRRGQIGIEATLGDGATRIRIDVDLAGVETWQDLLDLIEERIVEIENSDGSRFEGMSDLEKFDITTKILYGVRRW